MTESSIFHMLAAICIAITQSEGGRGHSLGVPEQDEVTLTPASLSSNWSTVWKKQKLPPASSRYPFLHFFILFLFFSLSFLQISGSVGKVSLLDVDV